MPPIISIITPIISTHAITGTNASAFPVTSTAISAPTTSAPHNQR